jgi:hypothetical protein
MALVLSDAREVIELTNILNENFYLRLFVNDLTPDGDTVIGSFTECTKSGYSAELLSSGNWNIQETGNQAVASYPQIEFSMPTVSGAFTVYGYYVQDVATSGLAWSERFSSSVPFSNGVNAIIRINPERTYRTQTT